MQGCGKVNARLAPSGLSTKDFIAPSSFEFRTGKQFRMGKKYGAVSFLQILAPELNDRLLADFLDMESSLIVSMHIQSVDQVKAIKTVSPLTESCFVWRLIMHYHKVLLTLRSC